mmetsp:Transcript_18575/g.52461  ORF Transcript_18575/g.52461 Transcript_18575/m.52461 type:complete len:286 (+) Transcript_18575:1108-1965(+)
MKQCRPFKQSMSSVMYMPRSRHCCSFLGQRAAVPWPRTRQVLPSSQRVLCAFLPRSAARQSPRSSTCPAGVVSGPTEAYLGVAVKSFQVSAGSSASIPQKKFTCGAPRKENSSSKISRPLIVSMSSLPTGGRFLAVRKVAPAMEIPTMISKIQKTIRINFHFCRKRKRGPSQNFSMPRFLGLVSSSGSRSTQRSPKAVLAQARMPPQQHPGPRQSPGFFVALLKKRSYTTTAEAKKETQKSQSTSTTTAAKMQKSRMAGNGETAPMRKDPQVVAVVTAIAWKDFR